MISLAVVAVLVAIFLAELFLDSALMGSGGAEGRRSTTPHAKISGKELADEDGAPASKRRAGVRPIAR
jgi:hypothetical protein